MKALLNTIFKENEVEITSEQIEKFTVFNNLLIEWNQKMNLTAITDEREVAVKHFYDSITPSFFYEFSNQKIIDIGVGAGFPSIPLKICFPNLKMTLVDSLNKRLIFLEEIIKALDLKDINLVHGRAEELAKKNEYRQNYDIALSRAVARLNIISELSLPFVKVGGKMISLKGANADEELNEAKKAINIMGGRVHSSSKLFLPNDYGERNIIIIDKVGNTPNKYPRKPGTPNKEPIV